MTDNAELEESEISKPETLEDKDLEPTESSDNAGGKSTCWNSFPVRYVMVILSSVGIAIVYGLKVNLSVAIVAMVNHTALSHGIPSHEEVRRDECGNSTKEKMKDGPFNWSEPTQGLVLASYFWGYMVSEIPGGLLAEQVSAKWVMWCAVVMTILLTFTTPAAAGVSYVFVVIVRVIEGLAAGCTIPTLHVLIAHWAPPNERGRTSSVIYTGMALGTVISMLMAGILATKVSWEAIFYITGALSSIWCVFWIFLVYDGPEVHPRISEAERSYILRSLGREDAGRKKHRPIPLLAVFTSLPFYAILVSHVLGNWGWYMLLIQLPTYMNQVLKFKLQENAGLSALPFLCLSFFSLIASSILDWASGKGHITTTTARKIATLTATVIPSACLVAVSIAGCNRAVAVTFMTIGVMCMGAMFSGYLANHIDIAPNFAGTLMGLTNTFATIPGFVAPIFVGVLTHGDQTVAQWQKIFCTTAGLLCLSAVFFTIFGSAEEQSWNEVTTTDETVQERRVEDVEVEY